jgi:uncharacterized protein
MPEVRRNDQARRYELLQGDQMIGQADFQLVSGAVMITHTEVDPARKGQGLGSQLARAALSDIRAQGQHLIPLCPYIVTYLKRHPDELDLVPEAQRGAFGL